MKIILFFSVLLCLLARAAIADLTDADFDRIRLIINEEIKPLKADIVTLKTDVAWMKAKLGSVDKQFESVDKRFESVDRQITHVTYITYGLIALIVAAIAVPQLLLAWRGRKDREQDQKIEALSQEIKALKEQRIINP